MKSKSQINAATETASLQSRQQETGRIQDEKASQNYHLPVEACLSPLVQVVMAVRSLDLAAS